MVGDIFQPTHLLFVLVVALLVLGPKRLPEVAKTLGKGIRDFRGAISGDADHPNPVSSYLTGDSSAAHDETPTPTGQTPAPVSGTPVPPPAAPTPTPATTAPPVVVDPPAVANAPVVAAPEPTSPGQPIATPATTAPPAPTQPAPTQPVPADDADTQVHPATSSAERHE